MPDPEDLREAQLQREEALRQVALGRRIKMAEEGHLTPVLRRWINADIVPIAGHIRRVAALYISGDMEGVALALGNPTTALSQRERPLRPLMEWCLRGKSPGRAELSETTYAEDLALAFMGSLIPRLAKDGATLSASLSLAADTLRDTVQGQFITSVQGAEAMQRIRQTQSNKWSQKRSLQRIAMQMRAQVKPQMLAEQRGEVELAMRGSRKVLTVTDYKGRIRRIEMLRTPDVTDWEIMSLCWHDTERRSATHPHRGIWLSFASMLLSLSQQSGGWFEVVDRFKGSTGRKHRTKFLQLSEDAHKTIARDVERWVGAGFVSEPMLVPPEDGDFLTVKHRKVTGQRPPKGLITDPKGTLSWQAACAVARTPWRVNEHSPAFRLDVEDDAFLALKLAAHRRLAGKDFYLPVNMDFRGRIYYRTPWVTPQSNDLGKSLLRFPPRERFDVDHAQLYDTTPLAMHFTGLTGNDKAGKAERVVEFRNLVTLPILDISAAASPLTLQAHLRLYQEGRHDEIPIQLDGTCNGLQHLSALMRDEVGAAQVNLTKGGDRPSDIYGSVAREVLARMALLDPEVETWMGRFARAGVAINRSLCKQPVMVLPYGGTSEAIRAAVKVSVLEQIGALPGERCDSPWHSVKGAGYSAFENRALEDHPLFNEDVRLLARLIHQCITPAIPKAMAAMGTLQQIGSWVGTRALAWQAGPREAPMWVVQAKSKASRKQVTMKGYHLPDVIRRLTLMTQTNEVDPRAHRTGIVANFIHSLDAEHLARTVLLFRASGGTCVGTIHDCVMCRPSEVALMHSCLRATFAEMYTEDPLERPVRVIETEGVDEGRVHEYTSWHEVARAAGVSFPEHGAWSPVEVTDSEWFFS